MAKQKFVGMVDNAYNHVDVKMKASHHQVKSSTCMMSHYCLQLKVGKMIAITKKSPQHFSFLAFGKLQD
jgi:ABC-type molybdate transport system ATPase subunit